MGVGSGLQPLTPNSQLLVLGGDSGVGSALACWSSFHYPRLAERPARRVLFPVDIVVILLNIARTVS